MSKNVSISIEAFDVRIEPSSCHSMNISLDMCQSDLYALIGQFKETDVLDCISEETILEYLRNKGYEIDE